MTTVVNVKYEECDVYCGRPSIWGNPYSHKETTLSQYKVKTKKEAISKYREYLLKNEELLTRLPELQDKKLGCWCAPDKCHCDVLIDLLHPKVKVNLEEL